MTSLELQKVYKKLLEKGRVDRIESKHQTKGLSAKTVQNIHQILASARKLAREQKLIATDPTEGYALPKVEHWEMKTLPVEQLRFFLREARESGVFDLYYLEVATGLRPGELLEPKWANMNLERGNRLVRRQVARSNGQVVEAPLKTKNAYRTLLLAEHTLQVLKQQRKKVGSSPWVFPSPSGGPISPDSVLHKLHRVLKRAGLPQVRFHDLRHTFATLALQNGVDINTVSGMLDHYSTGFMLDTYAHITTLAQRQAADTHGASPGGSHLRTAKNRKKNRKHGRGFPAPVSRMGQNWAYCRVHKMGTSKKVIKSKKPPFSKWKTVVLWSVRPIEISPEIPEFMGFARHWPYFFALF